MYARVVVPLSVDGIYTYSVPSLLEPILKPGMVVTVPFSGNKQFSALVVSLFTEPPEGIRLKAIEGIAEESIYFSENHIRFLKWIWEYYIAYPGDVLRAALPLMFRLESVTCVTRAVPFPGSLPLSGPEKKIMDVLEEGIYVSVSELVKLTGIRKVAAPVKSLISKGAVAVKEQTDPLFKDKSETFCIFNRSIAENKLQLVNKGRARRRVVEFFYNSGTLEIQKCELLARTGVSLSVLKGLCNEGILSQEERIVSYRNFSDRTDARIKALTPEQKKAFEAIRNQFEEKNCVLLHGITSSGKTEIYIHLIRDCIDRNRTALYILPEIALTIQIISRLKEAFSEDVGIFHSGMSDRDRAEVWKRQCSEHPYPLIVGVRSSVFLPFRNLGLVIVDEEHDASYKQKEPSPRYNARDAAVVLAKIYGAKVLLGSATPSFESYHNALTGKYGLVEMDRRYGNVSVPRVLLADMKEPRHKKIMRGDFTPLLYNEMKRVLEEGGQVILFQNRRGYSSFVKCENCGDVPHCPKCDVALTYYKYRDEMVCRYCGKILPVNSECTSCGAGIYRSGHSGTEQIEEEVVGLFPDYPVGRLDLDTVSSKKRLRNAIRDFESGHTKILIGTQMVVKGLDFANVRLVGILNADSIINFPDFRAEERAFSQMLQVAGRAGRRDIPGTVVIQTMDPEQVVLKKLLSGSYKDFYHSFIREREVFLYPPYCRLITLELRHKDASVVRNRANLLASYLRAGIGNGRVEGPVEPEVGRVNNLYRIILMIKISDIRSLKKIKNEIRNISRMPNDGCRLIVDVDIM